jgi:hypothetical protein
MEEPQLATAVVAVAVVTGVALAQRAPTLVAAVAAAVQALRHRPATFSSPPMQVTAR